MATSSAVQRDVFIDFSGKDTRNSFVSHLSAAFRRRKISVFINEDCDRTAAAAALDKDFLLPEKIQSAINDSRVSVVVLSENYAYSALCLETLVQFLERQRRKEELVLIPIFYGKVTREIVENQTEKFGDAFALHGSSYSADRVTTWRDALIETANLPGHESKGQISDSELVEKIVADVREKMDPMGTVGIYLRLLDIENLLCKQSNGIYRLGLWGMPGIGKTTLAQAIIQHMSHGFVASCFVENFHIAFHDEGMYNLREKHIRKLLGDEALSIDELRGKKVLVVLDDVRSAMGAESFLGGFDFIGPGSVIIVTSRDKQVLYQSEVKDVYEVPNLNEQEALRLFSLSALQEEFPSDGKFIDLSKKVVEYAKGNPLALSFLGRTLKNKTWEEMEAAFEENKRCPPKEIMDLFEWSYDALSENERSIFLDIACFFNGEELDQVIPIFEGCGFFPHVGIDRLVEQSLLTILEEKKLEMHDLIQDLGRKIINQETEQIGRRRRLWDSIDIRKLLEYNEFKGTEVIEGIFLDTTNLKFDVNPKAFENMYNLRLLKFYSPSSETGQELHLPNGLHSLPYELRLLHWEKYPLQSLPQDFDPSHLVELNMPYSQLQSLWGGTKSFAKLKKINLKHCKQLVEVGELSKACSLEKIYLQGCTSLETTPDISPLKNLQFLNLSGCIKIEHTEITEKIKGLGLECGLRETVHESMIFSK